MGLFDGGFDMNALMQMLGPSAANAAGGGGPSFDERFGASFPNGPGAMPPEVNPSPVPPGGVPLPRPNPLQPSPEEMAGATRLGLPRPEGNSAIAPPVVPPGGVGAALSGSPIEGAQGPTSLGGAPVAPPALGTSGATDISAQAKGPAARPSLAEALKGVKAPPEPTLQKISSPNAPRPTTQIKGGDLQALLMALNAGAPNLTRQLPVTLGGGRG